MFTSIFLALVSLHWSRKIVKTVIGDSDRVGLFGCGKEVYRISVGEFISSQGVLLLL